MPDGLARHTPQLTGTIQPRVIRCDTGLFPHVGDAITALTESAEWLEVESTIDDVTAAAFVAVDSYYDNAMIGMVSQFLNQIPDGWLALDGSTYAESEYPELYAVIDATFKDEPNLQFTLPDLRGYFVAGAGGSYAIGDSAGEDAHQLTTAEMPSHTHAYKEPLDAVDLSSVGAPTPGVPGSTPGTPTGATGNDQAHENRPPFVALVFAVFAGR